MASTKLDAILASLAHTAETQGNMLALLSERMGALETRITALAHPAPTTPRKALPELLASAELMPLAQPHAPATPREAQAPAPAKAAKPTPVVVTASDADRSQLAAIIAQMAAAKRGTPAYGEAYRQAWPLAKLVFGPEVTGRTKHERNAAVNARLSREVSALKPTPAAQVAAPPKRTKTRKTRPVSDPTANAAVRTIAREERAAERAAEQAAAKAAKAVADQDRIDEAAMGFVNGALECCTDAADVRTTLRESMPAGVVLNRALELFAAIEPNWVASLRQPVTA